MALAFQKLKQILGKAGTPEPSNALQKALSPIAALDETLFGRCVRYVHDGSGPELLSALNAADTRELNTALMQPGVLGWVWLFDEDVIAKLVAAGFPKSPGDAVRARRHDYYASNAPLEEFVRLGRLFTCIGDGADRVVEGVPAWLTTLVNDVAATYEVRKSRPLAEALPAWTPQRLAELASLGGVAASEVPLVVFWTLFEKANSYPHTPSGFAGVEDFLVAEAPKLPPYAAQRLSVDARTELAESNPRVATAIAPMLAVLATEKAKTVRTAAVRTLETLPADLIATVLPPVLRTVPAPQAQEIVELLSRTHAGSKLLSDAVASGAKLTSIVEKAQARLAAVQAAPADALVVPPYVSVPEPDNAATLQAEWRRALDTAIASGKGATDKWKKDAARKASKFTDADIRDLVQVATGGRHSRPSMLKEYNLWWICEKAPSLTLTQVLRLRKSESNEDHYTYAINHRLTEDTDLRAVDEALARAGLSVPATAVAELGRPSSYWTTPIPEVSWPWFAEHVDTLQTWLTASATDAADALAVLEAFPSLPSSLLPTLASLAAGTWRTVRPKAQALLAKHGMALDLALQGLQDGKGEIRSAAATWLASIGDASAIPALRARLAKERSEVARAAMLAALEALGDDIAPDLAPAVLLAEATRGLKGKPSAALAWLDLEALPTLSWADGTPVDPAIERWWVVLADKLRTPDGSGLIDRYLSLLDPDSAATLGRFALASWVAQDTKHPDEQQSRAWAAQEGPSRWQSRQEWLQRVRSRQSWSNYLNEAEAAAAIPVERHVAEAFADHQATYVGSASANRGLLALTTRMPGGELANAVQGYIRNHGSRRAQVDALMYPLFANGQPAAIQLLLGISRRFKQASVQETASKLVQALAEDRGWSADELADRTIPAAGFGDDRLLRLSFGTREFLGRATPEGGIELTTHDGKPIKALPAPRADEDAVLVKEARATLTSARKEFKSVLTLQTARLYEAMCAGRTWSAADWTEYLAGHPIVSQLLTRLVWLENPGPGQRAFRPAEDGVLLTLDDEVLDLAPDARVGLAHRVTVGEEAAAAWTAHLADYQVTPLFDQFRQGVPNVDAKATELDDLKGHLTDTFTFRGIAIKRGYTRGPAEDGGCFFEYTKQFSSAGLVAVLAFTGSYVPEENVSCATTTLSFRRGRREALLSEVPEILLAECYGDYQALAALGPFDPDWEKKAAL